MKKINFKIILIILIVTIVGITTYYFKTKDESVENIEVEETNTQSQETNTEENIAVESKIKVYITGEVHNPGLYEIAENSRIADAIEVAGNLTENAFIDKINLAYVLEDGMKIYIPNKKDKNDVTDETTTYVTKETDGQIVSGGSKNSSGNTNEKSSTTSNATKSSTASTKITEKININSATQTELETLPGIGSSTALKIINYRKENGKFKTIEEIKNVKGIGDAKYEKIKELIKV